MSMLFSPLRLRSVVLRNRVFVSPMCQYSCQSDGIPTDWHLVHLGARAVGGAGMVMTEATAVSPEGRISPFDTGLWSGEQQAAFKRLAHFIEEQGAVAAVQLAHAGRKASTDAPWKGGKTVPLQQGGWQPVAPSALALSKDSPQPRALGREELAQVAGQFVAAASRALECGFRVVELHMAHGYLLHSFLSPLSNERTDEYGGTLENRMRFPLQVAEAVRKVWPEQLPLLVRISATDWVPGGWDLAQSIEFARRLKALGVDMVDCSSGGMVPDASIPASPGFQVPFAKAIREQAGLATGAVGLITDAAQAEEIVATGQADAVFMARELLRNPYWPLHASIKLGDDVTWPPQYARAKPKG